MADAGPGKTNLLAWVGVASSLLTVGLTGWNYSMNNAIQGRVQALNEARFEVDRLKFVGELLAGISGKDPSEYTITVNLVKLTIGTERASQLFSDLTTSPNEKLSSLGRQGVTAIELEGFQQLVEELNHADKAVRLQAMEKLVQQYRSSQPAIARTLAFFSPARIDDLTANGRVNALAFLLESDDGAWTNNDVQRTRGAIALLERRHKDKIAAIGRTTRSRIDDLEVKLARISQQIED